MQVHVSIVLAFVPCVLWLVVWSGLVLNVTSPCTHLQPGHSKVLRKACSCSGRLHSEIYFGCKMQSNNVTLLSVHAGTDLSPILPVLAKV